MVGYFWMVIIITGVLSRRLHTHSGIITVAMDDQRLITDSAYIDMRQHQRGTDSLKYAATAKQAGVAESQSGVTNVRH